MEYLQYSSPAPPRSCITHIGSCTAPAACTGGARLSSATARTRSFLEDETDFGAVKYDLVGAVKCAAIKVAAIVALVAHEVGAQRGGELVLVCDEADVAGGLVHVEK
eukprot:5700793-Pleurochrysis_carterae.AAC.2